MFFFISFFFRFDGKVNLHQQKENAIEKLQQEDNLKHSNYLKAVLKYICGQVQNKIKVEILDEFWNVSLN